MRKLVTILILLLLAVGLAGPQSKKVQEKKVDTTKSRRQQKAVAEIEKQLKDTINYEDIMKQQKALDSLLRKKK